MSEMATNVGKSKSRLATKPVVWISLAAVLVAGLIVANIHLVFVAVSSQPGCVPHDKIADKATAQLRAAKSGC